MDRYFFHYNPQSLTLIILKINKDMIRNTYHLICSVTLLRSFIHFEIATLNV